ncbi:MAG: hypothetical protein WC619_05310 [Patescibacteria group bacterium]
MNSKKNLIVGGIIIVVLIVGALLWRGGFLRQGAEIAQQGAAVISNKMTDDIYVEITAQITFAGMMNPKNAMEAITKKNDELLNKYHISVVESGMYVQALYNDNSRRAELDKRVSQRLSELQKTGK